MVSLTVFADYMSNASNLTFVANENFWASDIDFSCICVWNSHVGQQKERAGALISPRHLLVANHWYPQSTNEILYFRGRSGTVYQRRAVSWRGFSVPQNVSTRPDTGVVLLDSPLDTNDVAVCALASTSLLGKVGDGYGVPFIYLNQRKEAVVKEIRSLTLGGENSRQHQIAFMLPHSADRRRFCSEVYGISGDSSSPSFLLVGRQLVLFGIHSLSISDSPVFLFSSQIQTTMDSLCTGYQIQEFDFSGFQTIPLHE